MSPFLKGTITGAVGTLAAMAAGFGATAVWYMRYEEARDPNKDTIT